MGVKAELNVIFNEESPLEKKNEFIVSLRNDGWEKISGIENKWIATFKNGVTEDAAMTVIRHDVDRASKKADILDYEALIKLGDREEVSFGPFYSAEFLEKRGAERLDQEK